MSETIQSTLEGGVLWVTLNRPERKNSISPDMREELLAALGRAREDDDVRCVALTGTGDAFCAGVDLARSKATKDAADAKPQAPDLRRVREAMKQGVQRIITAIWNLDKPVLAAVNGTAAGGGAQLALCCDLIIAAESARFIEIFVRRGLALDSGGGYLLPRLVGLPRAKELAFFGDPISAPDAERVGLINRAVPDADLDKTARDWAARLARGATRAIGASKLLLNRGSELGLPDLLEEEANLQALISQSEDFKEGVRAFMEKRDPDFKGR